MALDTYANLQLSIQSWADRSDAAYIAAVPDFIALFEANANAELTLRTRFNTTKTTLSLTSASPLIALPSDFLESKTLINTSTVPVQVIPIFTATSLYTAIPTPATSGPPKGVTTTGTNLQFAPVSDQTYSIDFYYYQKITALSTGAPTNWLLTNFPNLYLFGSLVASEAFLGSDPRLETWGNLYDNMLQKLSGSNERGQYGGSPLRVQVDNVA